MSKKDGNKSQNNKPNSYSSIMDLYFEEEDSQEADMYDDFLSNIENQLENNDDEPKSDIDNTYTSSNEEKSPYSNASSSYGEKKIHDNDSTISSDDKESEFNKSKRSIKLKSQSPKKQKAKKDGENPEKKKTSSPFIRKYLGIDDLVVPSDIVEMVKNKNFYPFGCGKMKKSFITINRLLYLFQRINILSMDHCTALTEDDSRRIYDIINVLVEVGLVTKIHSSSRTSSPLIKGTRRRKSTTFQFCSDLTTDDPIDLKNLQEYLE